MTHIKSPLANSGAKTVSIAGLSAMIAVGVIIYLQNGTLSIAQEPKPKAAGLPEYSPAPTAKILWNEILQPAYGDDYTKWKLFPEKGVRFPMAADEEPHGDYIIVYVNDKAYESIKNPSTPFKMKYGSVLVKENYPAGAKPSLSAPIGNRTNLSSRTVMWKVRGYKPSGLKTKVVKSKNFSNYLVGGEWFWAMYSGKGATREPSQPVKTFNENMPFAETAEFSDFVGEPQAGKPWLCVQCHNVAVGPRYGRKDSYGDYIWKLKSFESKSKSNK